MIRGVDLAEAVLGRQIPLAGQHILKDFDLLLFDPHFGTRKVGSLYLAFEVIQVRQ